jgi:hypothetical protein
MGINGTEVMPAFFSVVMSPICCVVGACLAVLFFAVNRRSIMIATNMTHALSMKGVSI